MSNQQMNNVDSASFDSVFLEKTGLYSVVNMFPSNINLQNQEAEILTVTNKIGIVNGIFIDLASYKNYFEVGNLFCLGHKALEGKEIRIILRPDFAKTFKWDYSQIKIGFFEEHLGGFLKNQSSAGVLQVLQVEKSPINQFLYVKIKDIDNSSPNLRVFSRKILGLYSAGVGSTPSMDDALMGMLIAAKSYGDDISVFRNSYAKTTLISQNMLANALEDRVSDNIRDLYENTDLNKIKYFADQIGACSGIDMLVGTYFYLKKRGGLSCLKSC